MTQLSAGICQRLQNADTGDEDLFTAGHTVQFLSIKQVTPTTASSNPAQDRYRIIISDGEHFLQAMLATQLNMLVHDNSIGKNTVAVIEKLTCNFVQNKRLIIILNLRVVSTDEEKIGSPVAIPTAVPTDQGSSGVETTNPAPVQQLQQKHQAPVQQQRQQTQGLGRGTIYPIDALSPYQNVWTIKARVTQKSDVKTWSNQRGEGKLFNVTLMDESGEIKATGFNQVVDELYEKLEEGKVYFITKGRVNLAKRKFSTVQNSYEITFEKTTEVEECHETTNLPTVRYNFISLAMLQDVAKDTICDVIGIIKEKGDLSEITSKATNKIIQKRELTLVDRTNFSVRMTLWGKQAENYNIQDNPVIAFKGVKVSDFGGRSLSMSISSTMSVNPDIDEAHVLRGWWDAFGSETTFQSHTSSFTSGSVGAFDRASIRSLNEVKTSGVGTRDSGAENFYSRATIMFINSDNLSYPGCAKEGCNKKVTEISGQGWRCENCEQTYPKPEYRYILSMAVADWSGPAWLQGFNDAGLAVFGKTANELQEIRERSEAEYNVIMHKSLYATYNFVCRAKQDTYNDTVRVRYGISRLSLLQYAEEARFLRDLLMSPWAA